MKLTLPVCASLFLSACTYQYFTVSGDQLSKNERSDFVVENDTLKVIYRFNGNKGAVNITIYNKTNEPLEINWRKSALIMNTEATGYYSPNLYVNGNIQQDSSNHVIYGNRSFFADVKADIYVNEPSQFIPPQSSISKVPLFLPVHFIELPLDRLQKQTYKSVDYKVTYQKIEYSAEKSPFSFRSYLNFNHAGNENRVFSLDHHFYVSEIWQTYAYPSRFPSEILDRGDFFY